MSAETHEDVDALKARIAELESTGSTRRFDGRGAAAWTIFVIAALLFPIALTAFWGQRTLTDTERFVATVAPLSEDPTIQKAVADTVSTAIITQLDAQARVSELLADTPRLALLAGPIATGVNGFVTNQVDSFMASDAFSTIWISINTRLQKSLIAALENEPTGAVSIQGDQVVLDTGDLIEIVKQRLVDRGLSFAANIPVPPRLDREVVLLTSPQLQRARAAYAIGQPVAQWLIYAVMVLFVAAILVSRRRARMIMATGLALVAGALVLRLAIAWGESELELTLQGTPFALAEQAFVSILTYFLLNAIRATFVLGIVLALVGWFSSGTSSAVRTRGLISGALSGAGTKASDSPVGELGVFFARTRTFWRVLIIGIAAAVLLLSGSLTGSLILWTTLVAVLALVVVEFLAAAGGANAARAATSAGSDPADAAPDTSAETVDSVSS
jgi:hypothetical protein